MSETQLYNYSVIDKEGWREGGREGGREGWREGGGGGSEGVREVSYNMISISIFRTYKN